MNQSGTGRENLRLVLVNYLNHKYLVNIDGLKV